MSIADWIIIALILAALGFAAAHIIRKKKNGGSCCGCCSSCSGCASHKSSVNSGNSSNGSKT